MKLSTVHPWNVPFSGGIALVAMLGLAPLFGWAVAGEKWMIAGAVVMVALAPVFIRWPVVATFGIYAFLATSLDGISFLQGGSTLTRPVGVLAIVVLAAVGLMHRRLVHPPAAAVWWVLFMVWGIVSAAWAIDPELVYGRLLRPLSLILLYLVAVSFKPTRRELYAVCVLTVVGGVVGAGLAHAFGFEGAGRGRVAIGDQDSNPNWLGRMLILPFALSLAGFAGRGSGLIQRAAALGSAGLIGMGMYITMSRTAIVAMIAVVSVLLYRLQAKRQLIAASVVLLALSATMPTKFFERITSVITGEDSTGSGRTEIWKIALESLDRFWLFGAGLNNYPEIYSLAVVDNRKGYGAHSMYVGVFFELGIVGLALMLAAIGSQLLALIRGRRAGHVGPLGAALEAACIGMLAAAITSNLLWSRTFWLVCILMAWVTCLERESQQRSDGPVAQRSV